jgi:hypothetical protein
MKGRVVQRVLRNLPILTTYVPRILYTKHYRCKTSAVPKAFLFYNKICDQYRYIISIMILETLLGYLHHNGRWPNLFKDLNGQGSPSSLVRLDVRAVRMGAIKRSKMLERKTINPFLNSDCQPRSGWWVLIFYLILASLLVTIILLLQKEGSEVSIGLQAILIAAVSGICQLLRRRPLSELLGEINLG